MEQYYKEHFEEVIEMLCVATGGSAFSVTMDENFTLLYGSDSYYKMHGYTKENMYALLQNQCVRYIYPDDIQTVRQYCAQSVRDGKKQAEWEMRIITGDGALKYVKCVGSVSDLDGVPVMHGFVIDITAKKTAEQREMESREILMAAMDHSDMMYWELNLVTDVCTNGFKSVRDLNMPRFMHNYPQCVIDSGFIHSDSASAYINMCRSLKTEAAVLELDVKVVEDKGEIHWKNIKYTVIHDKDGKPVNALGTSEDITAQKTAENKFNSQISYKNIMENNVISSIRLNLSQNLCSEGQSSVDTMVALRQHTTADSFFEDIYQNIPQKDMRREFMSVFNRQNLLESFRNGKTHLSIKHKYKIDTDRVEWLHTNIDIMENPLTKDVEALQYVFNVNEQMVLKELFETVVATDYDYVIKLDAKKNSYTMYYSENNLSPIPAGSSSHYDKTFTDFLTANADEQNIAEVAKSIQLNTVKAELSAKSKYSVVLRIKEKSGGFSVKKLQYSYINRENEQILLSRVDITEVFKEEQQKAEALNAALISAQQANVAKTDFLSRMSHEIRTPMNAIIGMSAIAAQSIGNDEQMTDCISKIGISARFLLSLINDILDMSRIESGKMLLHQEKFCFSDLLASINSICYAQAGAKNIDYECIVDNALCDYYIGDSMKLQQVIINILSNAVKFTPESGKVTLRIKKMSTVKKQTTIRFVVNDTGCGISEEFFPYIFDSFSQEDAGATSRFGGTGLGLAISKNLVGLMGGKIDARSIVGIGSEFTVDVKLETCEDERETLAQNDILRFANLNTLVVDDDPSICEYTVLILKEIGVKAQWVDSGYKAVENVQQLWSTGKNYDIIIVDWKMPGMDGLETAKAIRKIVGPDVTIIIMTAYDWSSIEHDAKLAGVNLMVSKPMFKTSLISAFHKVLGEKEENDVPEKKEYDFTGKRILLVEDHQLNAEVARKLLESKGAKVDCAENGVIAIEKFATTNVGYYDVILMDIRMPLMDGLQAAMTIRHLNKKTAKTVPIIAMTANAFDEDIERSKQAGMNAHLAKPIEPEMLYKTITHYIYG